MLFSSAVFLLLFLPATIVAYWLAPGTWRIPLLLLASYVFYLSWNPIYGLLLATSTVVNYVLARAIGGSAAPKRLLVVGIVFNLTILGFFKYAGFFTEGAGELLGWLGLDSNSSFDGLQVLLPLAISFFTFEMISALVDVYRGDSRVGGFLVFATYKAYFPKLIAGPITRYRELAPQLERPRELTFENFQSGVALFTIGLAKKLALSDNLAVVADKAFNDPGGVSPSYMALGVAAFGLQIYFDFSGYSDMARGVSRTLGFELPRNFNFPYAARSPSDFWQRWHMTLSRWLRDYLYIPLGGNRRGRAKVYRNLLITMMLGGLWHGAGLTFLAWGALHGALLCVSHALRGTIQRPSPLLRFAASFMTVLAVFFAWIFFRADSMSGALDVIGRLAELPGTVSAAQAVAAVVVAVVFVRVNQLAPRAADIVRERLLSLPNRRGIALAGLTLASWTAASVLARGSLTPFVYFQF
ncbi:MAG: MBOAT family O-acyltransferase [Solirubrobacteraceae bacterium]